MLKFIKFVDSSGVPTKLWQAYRGKSESPKVLAGALKTAYKTLFDTYPDANRKDNEALRNFFSSHTSVAENTVTLMVRTFKAMADMGNFDSPADLPEVDVEIVEAAQEVEEKGGSGSGIVNRRVVTSAPNGMTVNINIQLQIPATDKADVYDIFRGHEEASTVVNELRLLLAKVKGFEKEAHAMLATHETSGSRVVILEESYDKLTKLTLKQDELFRQGIALRKISCFERLTCLRGPASWICWRKSLVRWPCKDQSRLPSMGG